MHDAAELTAHLSELNRLQTELLYEGGFLLPDGTADELLDHLERIRELLQRA